MKRKLLDVLFGCSHEFSWPRREGNNYYQVCLLCGVEYAYDWKTMKRTEKLNTEGPQKRRVAARRQGRPAAQQSWRPRERRFKFETEVQYRYVGTQDWSEGMALNISRSGVMFRCELQMERGRPIEMIFEMPEEISGQKERKVLCKGTVARCISPNEGGSGFSVAATIEDYRFLQLAVNVQKNARADQEARLLM